MGKHPLSPEERSWIEARIAERKDYISKVVGFIDLLIADCGDKQSQWKDIAGVPGMMGVTNFEGLCFERETRRDLGDYLDDGVVRKHNFDRYRVYSYDPVWNMVFEVYCSINPSTGNTRFDEAVVTCTFLSEEIEKAMDRFEKIGTAKDIQLLSTAKRFGIEV